MTRARILADYVSSGDELALKAPLISPALVTPNLGTPSAGTMTNVTGIPAAQVGGVLPVGVTGGSGLTLVRMQKNQNLVVKYVSATTVDIDADFLTVLDTNFAGVVLSSVNLTVDITASGANGLDTGSEAAIWYHIYVIYNGTTVASLLSANATSPTMPSGYTYKKYVGAVNNPSSSFRNFHQLGNHAVQEEFTVATSQTSTNYTDLNCAVAVPITANVFNGRLQIESSDANCRAIAASYGSGTGNGTGVQDVYVGSTGSAHYTIGDVNVVMITPQHIFTRLVNGASYNVYCNGWKFGDIV
jgi:hypothetical protein